MDIIHSIKRMMPHIGSCDLAEIANVCVGQKIHQWKKGDYLFHEHHTFEQFIIVETGLIRSYYLNKDIEINLRFLCDGSIAMPFSAVAQSFCSHILLLKSNETVQCVTNVTGFILPIRLLLNENRSAAWERIRTELSARHYLSIEQRLRMIQHQRAIDRYKNFLEWMPSPIISQMPNVHIASYLGITPEALSRIKHQFHTP